jgi:hypothetical protein
MYTSEEGLVVCGTSKSDVRESVGERDLASVQLVKTVVRDLEFAA